MMKGQQLLQESATHEGMLTHCLWAQVQFMGTDCLAVLLTDSLPPQGSVPINMDMKVFASDFDVCQIRLHDIFLC